MLRRISAIMISVMILFSFSLTSKAEYDQEILFNNIPWGSTYQEVTTALAKQYDDAVLYLENKKLDLWVHNKTIQKAIESNRISLEKKKYLRSLKIKWYELVNCFFYNIVKPKYYNYLNYSLVSSIFIDKTILNEN